jgi:hypothetical protein
MARRRDLAPRDARSASCFGVAGYARAEVEMEGAFAPILQAEVVESCARREKHKVKTQGKRCLPDLRPACFGVTSTTCSCTAIRALMSKMVCTYCLDPGSFVDGRVHP